MSAPKPRPLKPIPRPSPPAGSTAFAAMLQSYYEMPGCRELVDGIRARKERRDAEDRAKLAQSSSNG
ncbi:HTH DNA binding protein [Arthrobacter phage Shrooms]|nr:HTH DNA binding protein [Arthrobacter phage Shrooms]